LYIKQARIQEEGHFPQCPPPLGPQNWGKSGKRRGIKEEKEREKWERGGGKK